MIQPETGQTLIHTKHPIAAGLFFFLFSLSPLQKFGKFHVLPSKCSVTKHRNGQFSDPLVPSIRHLTGSKVRTATASTFTLKRASLQLWSAANGLRLCRGKCKPRTETARVWRLRKLKEWQSVKKGTATTFKLMMFVQRLLGEKKGWTTSATRVYRDEIRFGVVNSLQLRSEKTQHHDWQGSLQEEKIKEAVSTERYWLKKNKGPWSFVFHFLSGRIKVSVDG